MVPHLLRTCVSGMSSRAEYVEFDRFFFFFAVLTLVLSFWYPQVLGGHLSAEILRLNSPARFSPTVNTVWDQTQSPHREVYWSLPPTFVSGVDGLKVVPE